MYSTIYHCHSGTHVVFLIPTRRIVVTDDRLFFRHVDRKRHYHRYILFDVSNIYGVQQL